MSNQTIPDPGRFRRQDEPSHETSGGSRALSALALLALVVGVPVVLWLLAGTRPVPDVAADQGDAHRPADLHHPAQRAAVRRLAGVAVLRGLRGRRGRRPPAAVAWRSRCRSAVRCRSSRAPWSGRCCWPRSSPARRRRRWPPEHSGAEVAAAAVVQDTPAGCDPTPTRPGPSAGPRTRSPRRSTWSGTRSTRWRRRRTATTTTSGTSPSGTWATAAATRRSTSSTRAWCSSTGASSSWRG